MDVFLGKNAKAYYNSASYASPNWVELTMARTVTLTLEAGTWDASRRGSGWKAMVATLKSFSAELDMLYQPSNAGWEAIRAAFFAGSMIELLFLDGSAAEAGHEGVRAEMTITSFGREEPLEEGLSNKVKAEYTLSDTDPTWYTS